MTKEERIQRLLQKWQIRPIKMKCTITHYKRWDLLVKALIKERQKQNSN